MSDSYGARDLVRNPSLLRIAPEESFIVEDKKAHKRLGVYIGPKLADEFFEYLRKKELLEAARKVKESAAEENRLLEGSLGDGL
ncbi:hypothetical protein [Nitratifractor sp.]